MAYKYPYDEPREVVRAKLTTNRRMWKLEILNVLTLGIYSIIFFIPFAFDLEKIHPSRTRSKQMNYLWAYLLSLFTAHIVLVAWYFDLTKRIGEALEYRKIDYEFGTQDFWIWYLVGSLFLVGPMVYFHKMCRAMNLLCEHYNENPVIAED